MALSRYWWKFKFSDLNSYNAILHIIIIIVQWNPSIMATIPCKCGHKSEGFTITISMLWVPRCMSGHYREGGCSSEVAIKRGSTVYCQCYSTVPCKIFVSEPLVFNSWHYCGYSVNTAGFPKIIWSRSYCSVVLWLLIFISELLMTMHPHAWLHNVVPINDINIGYLIIL